MASINSVVKRKQFIWLGIVLATVGVVGGGGWSGDAGRPRPRGRMGLTKTNKKAPGISRGLSYMFRDSIGRAPMRQPPASLRPI